jgi:hypothetical protein
MNSEQDRILEMVKQGTISTTEADKLIHALGAQRRSVLGVLWGPFTRLDTATGLVLGGLVGAASVAAGGLLGVRFDGAIDVHVGGGPVSFGVAVLEQVLGWGLFAVVLWAAAWAAGRRGRLVDFVVAVGLSRLPLLLLGLVSAWLVPDPAELMRRVEQSPFDPLLLVVAAVSLPPIVWCFVWLVQGYRTASGLTGGRLVLSFILAVIVAEVIAKVTLALAT